MEGARRGMVLHYHGICRNRVRKTMETGVPNDIQTVAFRFGLAVRRDTAWTGITAVTCVTKHRPQTRGWSLLGMRKMPMRKIRFERGNAAIHPKSIHTVHTPTARCSKCFMLSVCLHQQKSVAATNSSPIVSIIASIHGTVQDIPTTWWWPTRGLWCFIRVLINSPFPNY
jgi:hypothetical protein